MAPQNALEPDISSPNDKLCPNDMYVCGVEPTIVVGKLVPAVISVCITVHLQFIGSTNGYIAQFKNACISDPDELEVTPPGINEYFPEILLIVFVPVA